MEDPVVGFFVESPPTGVHETDLASFYLHYANISHTSCEHAPWMAEGARETFLDVHVERDVDPTSPVRFVLATIIVKALEMKCERMGANSRNVSVK